MKSPWAIKVCTRYLLSFAFFKKGCLSNSVAVGLNQSQYYTTEIIQTFSKRLPFSRIFLKAIDYEFPETLAISSVLVTLFCTSF
jgi:hypothetical protein